MPWNFHADVQGESAFNSGCCCLRGLAILLSETFL